MRRLYIVGEDKNNGKNDRGVFVVGPFEEIESYGKSEVSFSEGATSD